MTAPLLKTVTEFSPEALRSVAPSVVPESKLVRARELESRLVLVTPFTAQRWLSNSMWDKQRPLRDWHVRELAEAMKRGEFVEGTMVHFAKLDGEIHCINGQHTLHAVVKSDTVIRLTVATSTVESSDEIAALYSRTDVGLRRTLSDSYQAHDLATALDMSKRQVDLVGGAIRHINSGYTPSSCSQSYRDRSADERVRQIKKYGEAAKWYFEAISGSPFPVRKALDVASVIAVGLETFSHSPVEARKFWSQVAFSESLDSTDPRKTLINWLMANPVRGVNHAHRARVVAAAWNVYLAGGKLGRFKSIDWTKPLVLNVAA